MSRSSFPITSGRGFVYLAVVLDWATRRVLSWRLSNSMTADFCVEALEEAIVRCGRPEIVNTDQGSQVHRPEFMNVLQANGMDRHQHRRQRLPA